MNRRAIITGASSGIGRETAVQLAAEDWKILAVARRGDRLQALADAYPDQVFPLVADICDDATPDRMVSEAVEKLGGMDLLVNNAGTSWTGALDEMPVEEIDRILDLNVRALILCTRAAIPELEKSEQGLIVNVASVAAHVPMSAIPVYCASKAAVLQFSRCMNRALKDKKIRVCALSPVGTNTEIFDGTDVDPSGFVPAADMAALIPLLTKLPAGVDVQELIAEQRYNVIVGGTR